MRNWVIHLAVKVWLEIVEERTYSTRSSCYWLISYYYSRHLREKTLVHLLLQLLLSAVVNNMSRELSLNPKTQYGMFYETFILRFFNYYFLKSHLLLNMNLFFLNSKVCFNIGNFPFVPITYGT